MLPTLCSLTGVPVPTDRPLDGIDLTAVLDGRLNERPTPIFFWAFSSWESLGRQPWIDPELQQGTTPLVKYMGNIRTRNFQNFHYLKINETDYTGPRVMLGNRYKLVIHDGKKGAEDTIELFDLTPDPAEEKNLATEEPAVAEKMQEELRDWQRSVLESLTGADYKK